LIVNYSISKKRNSQIKINGKGFFIFANFLKMASPIVGAFNYPKSRYAPKTNLPRPAKRSMVQLALACLGLVKLRQVASSWVKEGKIAKMRLSHLCAP
jgi:hypothetical protein